MSDFIEPEELLLLKVKHQILAELNPTTLFSQIRIATAFLIGGILMSLISSPNAVVVTPMASAVSDFFRKYNGAGINTFSAAFFILLSTAILRFLSSSQLQFRILLSRNFLVLVAWTVLFGLLFNSLSESSETLFRNLIFWLFGGVGMLGAIILQVSIRVYSGKNCDARKNTI